MRSAKLTTITLATLLLSGCSSEPIPQPAQQFPSLAHTIPAQRHMISSPAEQQVSILVPTAGERNSAQYQVNTAAQMLTAQSSTSVAPYVSAGSVTGGITCDGRYSPHANRDRDGDGIECEREDYLGAQASGVSTSAGKQCFIGPRGGTYTITASGRKNYSGC